VKYRGVLHALAAAALFGLSTPAAKLLLRDLSPLMLSALLYLGAAAALQAYRFDSREALLFRELPAWPDVIGAAAMLGGVAVMLRERHSHEHAHERIVHEHLHVHDEHHQHQHVGDPVLSEPHSHQHTHAMVEHDHPHVSDVHHRHAH
jgi:hypothetical protein